MQEWFVTRVVRWSGPPAVVRVQTPADVVVAVPCGLPRRDVLGLARLVLSGREYAELRRKIKPASRASFSLRRGAVDERHGVGPDGRYPRAGQHDAGQVERIGG
jgi:hypothetical protein